MLSHPDRRLRVLMFCPQFRPRLGGTERQVELLSESLTGRGVAVEILTPRFEARWPPRETIEGGVPLHRFPFAKAPAIFGSLRGPGIAATVWNGITIDRLIRSMAPSFDVLHAHNASNPMVATAVRSARRAGLRIVVSAVSTGDWFDLTVLRRNPVWGSICHGWLLRHVDLWAAKSSAIREHLRLAGIDDDRIASLPNGVPLPDSPRALPELARHFLYLGRLAKTAPRDIAGLIDAFEQADIDGAELALVGDGDELEEIRRRVDASPKARSIHVPGHQDPQRWLSWADCLVQPSYVEGLSNALLEGMAIGLPCIAYDIPPNREVLDDGRAGILVTPGDRIALSETLRALGSNPGSALAWGLKARGRAERTYDLRKICQRADELYRGLAAKGAGLVPLAVLGDRRPSDPSVTAGQGAPPSSV